VVRKEPNLNPTSASMSQNLNAFYVLAIKDEFLESYPPKFRSATPGQWLMAVFGKLADPFSQPQLLFDPRSFFYYELHPNCENFDLLEDEMAFGFRARDSVSLTNFAGVSSQFTLDRNVQLYNFCSGVLTTEYLVRDAYCF
jgi:hypothetical protein